MKTCRQCDKIEPRGCGMSTCALSGEVIKDFDKQCTEECENEQK